MAGNAPLQELCLNAIQVAVRIAGVSGLLILSACKTADPPAEQPWRTVLDSAAIADPSLPLPHLTPLTGQRVTLVSWKRAATVPGVGSASFTWPTWATVAGELKDFCRRYSVEAHPDSAALRRRVERLLGMREGDGIGRVVVEFSVDSGNVFRPCPDPSIDTTSCPVVYDVKNLNALLDRDPVATRLLLQQILMSYVAKDGYPFTRGGYTYDWDPSAEVTHHVGLSEYVVKAPVAVEILSVSPVEEYCAAR